MAPAIPEIAPEIAIARKSCAPVLMPANRDASGLNPVARKRRPSVVRYISHHVAIAITIESGTPAWMLPIVGSAAPARSLCGYCPRASRRGPLTHQPRRWMAMKFRRIVVRTSGALRQSRSSEAIDAHAAPASVPARIAATIPNRDATSAAIAPAMN